MSTKNEKSVNEKAIGRKNLKKIAVVAISAFCVCIVFLIVLNTVIIPKHKLKKAMSMLNSGEYDSAYALLEEIENSEAINSNKYNRAVQYINSGDYESAYMLLNGLSYKDSYDKLLSIKPKYQQILITRANAGDTVFFGFYEQDNVTTNGKEDIEWNVLAKEDNRALLISKYALDCKQYNAELTDVTWETCSLRQWLNSTFLNDAFSAEEQALIQDTYVSADIDPKARTNPGNATTDKVFLLSINEVNKYFGTDESRKSIPTEYAKANGAYTSSSYTKNGVPTCWWWLRSPGDQQNMAASVHNIGSVLLMWSFVHYDNLCVRPAVWVSFK